MSNFIRKNRILVLCFALPIFLLTGLFIVKGISPFGEKSNLMWDMEIQYTDFFAYYKNVLSGKESLAYSFSKSLGGPMMALWGYYLSSPLNLLVVFFKHSQFQLFVFVITALKLGLCGLTFGIFLKTKYYTLSELYILFFSAAYAFTQYGVGQISNIMWLDGMYMLPLMMLATDKYITAKKVLPLYMTVALSIIFNWYTAYMNCIFIMLYFIYSYVLSAKRITFKPAVKALLGFAATEISGVLASCFVFFPVLTGQSGGRAFDEGIFNFGTNGSFFGFLRGFMIGSGVGGKGITLFCSIFSLFAVGCYFLNNAVKQREKIFSGLFIGIMVASMFFVPLEHIWVGFKFESSYSYRFLYTALAAFITVAARGMSLSPVPERKNIKVFVLSSIIILLVLDMFSQFIALRLWFEIAVLIIYGLLFFLMQAAAKTRKTVLTAVLILVFLGEIAVNAYLLTDIYFNNESSKYVDYVENENRLIAQVRPQNGRLYRTEKTLNRDFSYTHDSFYSNESLAYNYPGIQHYSSSYENTTSQTLINLGYYRKIFPGFYHDPLLGADSLLGVKYLLSEKQYDGYILRTDLEAYNEKSVYENAYALPLAFYADESVLTVKSEGKNPFDYLNEIYSGILGEETKIYTVCDSVKRAETAEGIKYTIPSIAENSVLYIQVSNNDDGVDCNISIDGGEEKGYNGGWLNHNVIPIGNMGMEHTLSVNRNDLDIKFYFLDLNVLKKAADTVSKNEVYDLKINKNNISFTAAGAGVMLTVPYDEQWDVTVDGERIEAGKGADAFIFIPLENSGEKHIVMRYHTKGLTTGIALSAASVAIIIFLFAIRKKI